MTSAMFAPAALRAALAALALGATALSGCALIDPYNVIGRQAPPGGLTPVSPVPLPAAGPLSPDDRARAFDFVWSTINDRYYDPKLNGVDWKAAGERFRPLVMAAKDDDAFWETLDRMTGEMKDAHTRVESPKRAEQIRSNETISLGFAFVKLDGRLVVSSVHPDSDAWWAGVRPGMTLAAIEGEPALPAYEKILVQMRVDSTERSRHFRAIRKISAGELDSKAAFTFARLDGTTFDATLKRRKSSTSAQVTHRTLPSGMGYVRITQWTGGAGTRAVEAIRSLKDAPGLIVDLRGNPGGSLFAVNEVLKEFFPGKVDVGRALTRKGEAIGLFFGTVQIIKLKQDVTGGPESYKGPVIVLVNAGSGSGSEYFSGAMQALGRATIMGQTTCGCLLGFMGYAAIPGGGELAYSEVGFEFVNGKRIEGVGVIPEKEVPLALADLQLNRDRALEDAQSLLATMGPWKKNEEKTAAKP